MYELGALNFQSYVSMLYIRIESTNAIFVWRALRNFAMMDFEENVKEMVGTTREAAAVAKESGGNETATRPRTRPGTRPAVPAVPGTRPATAGDETAATGAVLYTDEGELEFDEDEMAALKGQRLVVKFRCEI